MADKKPETCSVYDFEWVWVAPNGIERGRWHATDATNIDIFPPSEGYVTWMVTVPYLGKEILVEMAEEDAVFLYAANSRRARAN